MNRINDNILEWKESIDLAFEEIVKLTENNFNQLSKNVHNLRFINPLTINYFQKVIDQYDKQFAQFLSQLDEKNYIDLLKHLIQNMSQENERFFIFLKENLEKLKFSLEILKSPCFEPNWISNKSINVRIENILSTIESMKKQQSINFVKGKRKIDEYFNSLLNKIDPNFEIENIIWFDQNVNNQENAEYQLKSETKKLNSNFLTRLLN